MEDEASEIMSLIQSITVDKRGSSLPIASDTGITEHIIASSNTKYQKTLAARTDAKPRKRYVSYTD